MPFKPGQSGNPAGRPKLRLADGRSLSDVAKEHTEAAINTLVAIAQSKKSPATARVQAATALLDRGWGRPHQAVLVEGPRTSLADELEAARLREFEYLNNPGKYGRTGSKATG